MCKRFDDGGAPVRSAFGDSLTVFQKTAYWLYASFRSRSAARSALAEGAPDRDQDRFRSDRNFGSPLTAAGSFRPRSGHGSTVSRAVEVEAKVGALPDVAQALLHCGSGPHRQQGLLSEYRS